jgi:hypothetical protein
MTIQKQACFNIEKVPNFVGYSSCQSSVPNARVFRRTVQRYLMHNKDAFSVPRMFAAVLVFIVVVIMPH